MLETGTNAVEPLPNLAMDLHEKIRSLPTQPGVYLYKNAEGEVIYVGKANNFARGCGRTCWRLRRPTRKPAR